MPVAVGLVKVTWGNVYGLPESADLSFLRGLVLSQLAIGQNETILRFDVGAEMVLETDMTLSGADGLVEERTAVIARLVPCLGAAVDHVEWERDGTLRLSFEGHDVTVHIRDDSDSYESYAIYFGDRVIVV